MRTKFLNPCIYILFWNTRSSHLFAVPASSQQTGSSVAGDERAPQVVKFDSAKLPDCFPFDRAEGTWTQCLERLEFSKASLTEVISVVWKAKTSVSQPNTAETPHP